MEEILTPEQVSQLLQIHPFTVLKFIRQGKLKASKLGRMYRVRRGDVDKFLDNQANAVMEPKTKTKKGKEPMKKDETQTSLMGKNIPQNDVQGSINQDIPKETMSRKDEKEFSSDSVLTPESKETPLHIDKEFQPPKDETDHYVIELNY